MGKNSSKAQKSEPQYKGQDTPTALTLHRFRALQPLYGRDGERFRAELSKLNTFCRHIFPQRDAFRKGWIEAERLKTQKEREAKEQAILAQKLGGLDMSHRRRYEVKACNRAILGTP